MAGSLARPFGVLRDALRTELDWDRDGADWPHRTASRFVRAGGIRWHVQQLGEGPDLLLLHGTGSSTHSFRDLAPLLARRFRVTVPDLPGHAFTERPAGGGLSMTGMSRCVAQLLERLDVAPAYVAGHSAGAAVLCRMRLDRLIAPRAIIGLSSALMPLSTWARPVLSPLARALVATPVVPRLLAWRAEDPRVVGAMLRDTGSRIDRRGIELYTRLWARSRHVASTLAMMAAWDLEALVRDLPALDRPLHLVVPGDDRFIPADDARRIRDLAPEGRTVALPGLGHLAHEEQPERVADAVLHLACATAPVDEALERARPGHVDEQRRERPEQ